MKEKIYLSQAGYNEYLNIIENEKKRLYETGLLKREANEQAPGDGWHDNFLYEDAVREENMALNNIENLLKKQNSIQIISKHNKKEYVDINDWIVLEMIFDKDDKEIATFHITGNYKPNQEEEITINSPLGKAIYNKKVGSTLEYKVNDNKIVVKIQKKL